MKGLSAKHNKSSFELGIQVLELFGKASHCSHHPSPVLSGDLLPLTSKIRSDKVQPNIYFVLPLAEILAREVTWGSMCGYPNWLPPICLCLEGEFNLRGSLLGRATQGRRPSSPPFFSCLLSQGFPRTPKGSTLFIWKFSKPKSMSHPLG